MNQGSDKTLTPSRYNNPSGEHGAHGSEKGDEFMIVAGSRDPGSYVYTMEQAMDIAGYGAFNKFAIFACCLVYVQAVLKLSGFVFVIDLSQCDLAITAENRLILEVAIYFGLALASIYWGLMSDRYGRRKIILICNFCSLFTSFVNTLVTSFWTFVILRLLTGCVISGVFTTLLVYVSEFSLGLKRDKSIAVILAASSVALVVAPVVALFVIPSDIHYELTFRDMVLSKINSWRMCIWSWNVSGLVGGICFFWLPRSPAYILATDGPFKALPIIRQIHDRNHYKFEANFPVRKMKISTRMLRGPNEYTWQKTIRETSQLFRPPLKRCMIIGHFCMFMVYVTLNCLYLRLPNIYQAILEDTECPCSVCELLVHNLTMKSAFIENQYIKDLHTSKCTEKHVKIDIFIWATASHSFFVFVYTFIATIINTTKKTTVYAFAMIPCSISLFAGTVMPQAVAAGMLATIPVTAGIGVGLITLLVVEICPTCLRTTAIGSMNALSAIGAGLTIIFLSWTVTKVSCVVILLTIAFFLFLSVYILVFQWPEIEEIRKVMEKRNFTY